MVTDEFKTFALLYPVEAYELDPVMFREFLRGQGYNLTDDKIREIVEEIKTEWREKHGNS